jgi:hypothetical protein
MGSAGQEHDLLEVGSGGEPVIVYRDIRRKETPPAKLARLAVLAARKDALGFLVEIGELEQGLLDAAYPQQDDWSAQDAMLRAAALAAGRAFCAAIDGRPVEPGLAHALSLLKVLDDSAWPRTIWITPPEGYVHYALDPAGYVAAAAAYRDRAGQRAAARAGVVGVRSIGTSLSAAVAALLGTERTLTVRPRGRTGARHIAAGPALEARMRSWLRDGADVLVVDEGPGATGETLWCVREWLRGLGLPDSRLVLVPSRTWGMPLAPEERQAWFAAARKLELPHADTRPARLAARLGIGELEDLSAGRWREALPGARGLPTCPGHERRKYRGCDAQGRRYAIRYIGLGQWGEEAVARAAALAHAGVGAPAIAWSEGFLACEWLEGRPASRAARSDTTFVETLARYLCTRARLFRTGEAVDPAPILEMLVENATEALGASPPGLAAAVRRIERLPLREAVVADARLQLWEWICTSAAHHARSCKVDAVDHGDGLRLPGPTDSAWDLAGAAVEYELSDGVLEELARRYAAATGESAAELTEATRAYRPAYAALALGEATLALWEVTDEQDRQRLAAEVVRYRRALRHALDVSA